MSLWHAKQVLLSLAMCVIAAPNVECAAEYYVSAADGSPCPSDTVCHNISHYAASVCDNRTTCDSPLMCSLCTNVDLIFYFMEGTHFLDNMFILYPVRKDRSIARYRSVLMTSYGSKQGHAVIRCTAEVPEPFYTPNTTFEISSHSINISDVTITGCQVRLDSVTTALHNATLNESKYELQLYATDQLKISSCSFVANELVEIYTTDMEIDNCQPGKVKTANVSITQTNITFNKKGVEITTYAPFIYLSMDSVRFHGNNGTACTFKTIETHFNVSQNQPLAIDGKVVVANVIFSENQQAIDIQLTKSAIFELINAAVVQNGAYTNPQGPIVKLQCSSDFWCFIKNSKFSDNNGTLLLVKGEGDKLFFAGTNLFQGNLGYNGGVIVMDAVTQILIDKSTKLSFINNRAISYGGVLYILPNVDQIGYHQPVDNCFYVQYGRYPVLKQFYFDNNSAGNAGSIIYGANATKCNDLAQISVYVNNQTQGSVISSDVTKVCFCNEKLMPFCDKRNFTVTAVPGQKINFTVAAVGDSDGLTEGVLQITDGVSVTDYDISTMCILLNHTVQVTDSNTSKSTIKISALGSPRFYIFPVEIFVTIAPCADGFHLQDLPGTPASHVCQCDGIISAVANVECHSSNGTVTRQGNMWLAYDNCTIVHNDCPFDYCTTNSVTLSLSDPDAQCSLNRSGRLCGGCLHNYSLSLGSNKCLHCGDTKANLLFVIPLGIAGITLVALLIAFNLTVSVGTINGLVFYANIVKLYEPIFFPNGRIIFLSQFISWLNLDLGIETCFYHSMTSCHKIWLQFVFPFYLWTLIVIVIIACRYSFKVTRIVGNNAVPVLATLLLLSYTKLLRTIILILSLTRVSCNHTTTVYWLVDPNIPYLTSCHLPLFIVAVMILLLLVVPYTAFLFLFPLLETSYRYKWRCFQKCYNKLKPFLDAYGGPYRDKFHYWTGVLVFLRVVLALVVALADDPTIATNILVMVISIYTVVLSIVKVHISKISYLLSVISCASLIAIAFQVRDSTSSSLDVKINKLGVMVIMGCNIALFLGIILCHFYKYIYIHAAARCRKKPHRSPRYRHEGHDSDLELREPLLDDVD